MSRLSLSLAGILLCSVFTSASATADVDEKHSLTKDYSSIKASCLIHLANWSYHKDKTNREIELLTLRAQKHTEAGKGEWSNTPFLIHSKDYTERWGRLSKALNRSSSSCLQPFLDCAFLSLISVEYEVSEIADTEESLDEFDALMEAAEDQADRCDSADSLATPIGTTPFSVINPPNAF